MSNKNKNKGKNKHGYKGKPTKKAPLTPEESAKRTRRIIITVICVILAAALIVGAVLGIISAVREASYVMKSDRVGIDKGVASFLISVFKYDYILSYKETGVDAKDTDEFWNQPRHTGNEGDLFNYYAANHIKEVLAANAFFDQYAELTAEDEKRIALAVDEVLNYKASGSKEVFNSKTEKMGFDFDDFKKGSEMLYKAGVAASRVFGEGGVNMPALFPDYCEDFYENSYIRAKILIIRTEDTFVYDENGDPVYETDGDGNKIHVTKPLSETEKNERAEYIARLDKYVEDLKLSPNSTITKNQFNNLLSEIANKYKENVISGVENGYYLMRKSYISPVFGTDQVILSDYTAAFGLEHVVEQAYSLETDEIYVYESGATASESDTKSFSYKCYVYKMEKEEDAYTKSSLDHFFWDFYSLAAFFLYNEIIDEKVKEAEVKDKWDEIDPVSIPMNDDIYVLEF